MTDRHAIFISHASPEQNTFTIWLGSKLAELGYEVWADVLKLLGGDDWQRKLEDALRNRAAKVLLAADAVSVGKQGVRNEIQIASDTARKIGDETFVIPLKLAPFDAPFLVVHAQYVPFDNGWARGLLLLLEHFEEMGLRPTQRPDSALWRNLQLINGRRIERRPEALLSNWLEIKSAPRKLRYYTPRQGVPHKAIQDALQDLPIPSVEFAEGIVTFGRLDEIQDDFGPVIELREQASITTERFLGQGWPTLDIPAHEARKTFVRLCGLGIAQYLRKRGLSEFELSGGTSAWWGNEKTFPKGGVPFALGQWSGRRQIRGYSKKRKKFWSYSVSLAVRTSPPRHVRVRSHLIFSDDGKTPLGDVKAMHRLRRSFAKSWRNARWRDMQLAFLSWVSDGKQQIEIPLGDGNLVLETRPMQWTAPIRVSSDSVPDFFDDDDPNIPVDEFDDPNEEPVDES